MRFFVWVMCCFGSGACGSREQVSRQVWRAETTDGLATLTMLLLALNSTAGWQATGAVHRHSDGRSCDLDSDRSRAFHVGVGASLQDAMVFSERVLNNSGDPEAEIAALHLVAHAVGETGSKSLHNIRRRGESHEILDHASADRLACLLERRSRREPVQYLIGEWDFHDLQEPLKVRRPVLIPRPETEDLVDRVIKWVKAHSPTHERLRFLDVGAGSGAIGLALLNAFPSASCVAIDIASEAVALAKENARIQGLEDRYTCLHLSLMDFMASSERSTFDLVVSNPPYIPSRDMSTLPPEVRDFEDHGALSGGEDGMEVIRELVEAMPLLLKERDEIGFPRTLWLEVDPSHPEMLQKELHGNWSLLDSMNDLGGMPRFCVVECSDRA